MHFILKERIPGSQSQKFQDIKRQIFVLKMKIMFPLHVINCIIADNLTDTRFVTCSTPGGQEKKWGSPGGGGACPTGGKVPMRPNSGVNFNPKKT